MVSPLTLSEFLDFLGIDVEKVGDVYYLTDRQGGLDLDNDENEDEDDTSYHSIADVIDRVDSLWFDWIVEDLQDEFGCEEDLRDIEEVVDWMTAHKDEIYPETYDWYMTVINCILNPNLIFTV